MKLNARQVDTAKAQEKPYKLSDGGSLGNDSNLLVECIAVF